MMRRKLTRSASSQLVHRAIPRVLKREFLSVETINLWLQCKVSPWMQLVHPLDFESIQLSLDYVEFLCQFLGCFYERLACWVSHLFFPLLAVYPRACPFNRYSARLDCGNKSGVILPGLVGVRLGEDSNSALESIASPQVATDLSRVAGARMGTGESPATEPAIVDETLGVQTRDIHGQLHISQLANIKVDGVRFRPPKEEITGGLHDVLSTDDPLTMARIGTGAEVTFENRSLGLLDLEEERVAALVSPEQGNITARAHASHTDDVLDNINEVVFAQKEVPILLERSTISRQQCS